MTADPMQRAREAAERVAATIHKINGHWWNRRKRPEAPDLRLILDALLTREEEVRGERYRHVKRGTVYEVVGEASLQIATYDLVDGSDLVIYRGEDGKLWAREHGEFHDGRFEKAPPAIRADREGVK